MPNWCWNTVTVSHEEPSMMERLTNAFKEEKLFNEFVPNPSGDWEYGWSTENWGTKWEARCNDIDIDIDGSAILSFETAWAPPVKFYEKIAELGFKIDATYIESGLGFAGAWNNEIGDDYYEFDFENENWRDAVDNEDVLEMMEGEYESFLEWKKDEEENLKDED